ncbi:hypothetical protein [Flavicella sediminum]|uniref:hypothetical protein n=1 Tax=Flavicella sediminum TaxID=2585141 RepID=UPI001121C599|nr:hypothetical protein [Flavicella sediminum]
MEEKLISRKKPSFLISKKLNKYLTKYSRNVVMPIFYEDLLRYSGAIEVYDKSGEDTLWLRVFYPEFEREEIERSLKKIYTILHADGSDSSIPFLNVDEIDYCTFGNSKPFRIKIRNILNDNYMYMYIKVADASRVYGLELEHLLSPDRINFLVYKNTLVEGHIQGIPGDVFMNEGYEHFSSRDQKQLSKEFVKFNERSIIRLLGDMRSYNYVIVPTHDFDQVQYRIRAIDFDQQSYEGKFKVYMPQFLKENNSFVSMVHDNLREESIEQYKIEERSAISKRILRVQNRIKSLLECMAEDKISTDKKVKMLRKELFEYTKDVKFKKCNSMGSILKVAFEFVVRNYENVNHYVVH